jgi:hypothetical protein
VTQQSESIKVALTATSQPLYYEVSATLAQNETAETGTIAVLNGATGTFTADELNLLPGYTYKIYVRSACDNGTKSAWSGPKILEFQAYCGSPTDLGITGFVEGIGFSWHSSDSNNSYYQISYGPQGFAIENGTMQTLNNTYYVAPLVANTTYDFYVRSYCTAATGWSSWSGPYTYYSEYNQNLCTTPSNIQFTLESSTSANFTWYYNGESEFEYALVSPSQTINNTTINTLGTGGTPTYFNLSTTATYTFYVRAVCANGNKTPWATRSVHL